MPTEQLDAGIRIGVVYRPQLPPEQLRVVVQAAEASGLDDLWCWEDCFLQGGLTTATAALAMSSRINVGVGLLPVPLRNPALAAMEIANVARMWPGRFSVALGHGIQEWMTQVGEGADSPMTLLRECATAIRDLVRGEDVTTDGRYVRLDHVSLEWAPTTAPTILVGGRGPKTIQLAGELVDGVLLDGVTDPHVIRAARRNLEAGRKRGDLQTNPAVFVYTEVDSTRAPIDLRDDVADRIREFASAGAAAVIFQPTGEYPDPTPIINALADWTDGQERSSTTDSGVSPL
jgi:alkanesulfonate monooxygenase SsuD/methylene tetrahydromethanopterin reductase-like flavin-dependent oxidoreductase (luciferase family)